ncbi:hydrogenase large subunit [Flindersiella endophytica]
MTTPGPIATSTRSTFHLSRSELVERSAGLLTEGFRLALVAGHDDGDTFRVVYLFLATNPDRRTELSVHLDRAEPYLPTIAGISFPGGRFERELHDLFGITPVDHPLPRRLVRHFHWPKGWHPMRADAGEPPAFGDPEGPYPFRTVEGPGVYEIPVGPVHAGLIEPGHFRFSVVGETILKLKPRLWFVYKGIEKLFQGRTPQDGVELAERISGDTAVGHCLAYSLAVEEALGIPVSPSAQRVRALLLELERIYNHITDIGALCNDVGYGILSAHAQRVREQLLRLNADTTGHRLLRGAIRPGHTEIQQLPDPTVLTGIAADIAEIVQLALGNSIVRERFTGTAVLSRQQAGDLATLGYVARASGVDIDARRDHPFVELTPALTVHTSTDGDVLARFNLRANEIQTSLNIITQLAEQLELKPGLAFTSTAQPPRRAHASSGAGIVEGWRGTLTHRIELDDHGRLTRVKIVDPSFFNWPALPVALTDTIVPDFPLTNKSFNLSYAGNDL